MKKSFKGEVVLSTSQIQATRLNKIEHRRLQRNVTSLHENYESQIARLRRQQQGLRYHFTNVVRVVKPHKTYELWKQAHAYEIEQDETEDFIEKIKRKQRSMSSIIRKPATTATHELPPKPLQPLLLLLENESEKPVEPFFNLNNSFSRPKTSPNKQSPGSSRVNILLNMLSEGRPTTSNMMSQKWQQQQQQQPKQQSCETSSFYSSSSTGTSATKKLVRGNFVTTHNDSNLDAYYRIALQNQAAYKPVEQKCLEERKLRDKEFASQYRALRGTMRSAGFATKPG